VGRNCAREPEIFTRFERSLADAGIGRLRVLMTPLRLSAIVRAADVDAATRALHAAMLGA